MGDREERHPENYTAHSRRLDWQTRQHSDPGPLHARQFALTSEQLLERDRQIALIKRALQVFKYACRLLLSMYSTEYDDYYCKPWMVVEGLEHQGKGRRFSVVVVLECASRSAFALASGSGSGCFTDGIHEMMRHVLAPFRADRSKKNQFLAAAAAAAELETAPIDIPCHSMLLRKPIIITKHFRCSVPWKMVMCQGRESSWSRRTPANATDHC